MTNTGIESGRNLDLGSDKEENPGKTTKFCAGGIESQPSERMRTDPLPQAQKELFNLIP